MPTAEKPSTGFGDDKCKHTIVAVSLTVGAVFKSRAWVRERRYGPLRLRAGRKNGAADCLPPRLRSDASESLLDISLNPTWVTA